MEFVFPFDTGDFVPVTELGFLVADVCGTLGAVFTSGEEPTSGDEASMVADLFSLSLVSAAPFVFDEESLSPRCFFLPFFWPTTPCVPSKRIITKRTINSLIVITKVLSTDSFKRGKMIFCPVTAPSFPRRNVCPEGYMRRVHDKPFSYAFP